MHKPLYKKALRNLRTVWTLAAAVVLLAGCQSGHKSAAYTPVIRTPQQVSSQILGYSRQQRPLELLTLGTGPEVVLIMSTIHGNEDAGTPLLYELLRALKRRTDLLDGRTIRIIPVANPDGMALRTRANAAGIDLNRNFPASNRVNNNTHGQSGLTEPESKLLHDLILDQKPARILTLHQPLVCIDYDGPGAAIANRMEMFCNLPVKKLGARPGSLGAFAEEQGIPIITMELKASDSLLSPLELWADYGPAVMAFVTWPQLPY